MSRATELAPWIAGLALAPLALAAGAHGVRAQDRYGAGPAPYPAAAAEPSAQLRGRMLDWPGKQAAGAEAPVIAAPVAAQPYAPPQRYAGRGYVAAAYSRAGAPPQATRAWSPPPVAASDYAPRAVSPPRYRAAYTPPVDSPAPRTSDDGWRPVFAGAPASRGRQPQTDLAGAPAPLPTSIYTPAPQVTPGAQPSATLSPAARAAALPPPRGWAAQRYGYAQNQDDHSVHFYSVHRAFGIQPDPAPIPPQFFTATADLAAPPGPLPTERTVTSSSGSKSTVRAEPDAGTD